MFPVLLAEEDCSIRRGQLSKTSVYLLGVFDVKVLGRRWKNVHSLAFIRSIC